MLEIYFEWRWRPQQFDDLVDRVCRTFSTLASAGFDSWYRTGWSREQALRYRLGQSREEIQEELNKGAIRTKPGAPIIRYSINYWTGTQNDEESCTITIGCGGESRPVPDFLRLRLAHSGPLSLKRLGIPRVEDILVQLLRLWVPDQAAIKDQRMATADPGRYPIRLARLIYLKADCFRLKSDAMVDRSEQPIDNHRYIRVAICDEVDLEPSPKCLERAQLVARSVERIAS